MKVYVHHDHAGAVHSLIVSNAPADRIPMLTPGPDLFVAEVEGEVPGLKSEPNDRDLDALRQIVETLRVATPIPRCKLVSKFSGDARV
jgi:hypothetical protein